TEPSWVIDKPWYLYFYKWVISYDATCDRVPITARVGNCPVVTYKSKPYNSTPRLHPNPFTDVFFVAEGFSNAQAKVSDLSGRKLLEFRVNGQTITELKTIKPGSYILEIYNGK